jgi:hypothetical protein
LQVFGIVCAVLLVAGAVACSYASTRGVRKMVGVVVASGRASIVATDQLGVQGALKVDRVLAPGPSWVAVYNQGMGGMPATRAGFVHVPAGESTGVAVPLDPAVRLSERVVVVLQADRGVASVLEFDQQRFDASPDKPYWAGGAQVQRVVWVRFNEMGNTF